MSKRYANAHHCHFNDLAYCEKYPFNSECQKISQSTDFKVFAVYFTKDLHSNYGNLFIVTIIDPIGALLPQYREMTDLFLPTRAAIFTENFALRQMARHIITI